MVSRVKTAEYDLLLVKLCFSYSFINSETHHRVIILIMLEETLE